jgi:hypothetical protein
VNVVRLPQPLSLADLAAMGIAGVRGPFLYRDAMARFEDQLASLQERAPAAEIRSATGAARLREFDALRSEPDGEPSGPPRAL